MTADLRTALEDLVEDLDGSVCTVGYVERELQDLLAAHPPAPTEITDAMIEAGARVLNPYAWDHETFEEALMWIAERAESLAESRAVLTAALSEDTK